VRDKDYYYLISPADYGGSTEFALTYQSAVPLVVGQIVVVPLGKKQSLGVVTAEAKQPAFPTREAEAIAGMPALPEHLVQLAEWLAGYYVASPTAVWQTMLPTGLTKKRRLPGPATSHFESKRTNHQLTPEQAAALAQIQKGESTGYLLHGITGSGKTELYVRLAAAELARGHSVIVLVPEITLTPQLIATFESHFGDIVIATHSKLTEAERHRAWLEAAQSEVPRIIIGPRSSLFLPVKKLGLIVVDECHETSYKQEQSPRYHAVVVAARLAHLAGAKLVLGSATPGLTELYWASHGRLQLLRLDKRTNDQALPDSSIIDLRDKALRTRNQFLSDPLLATLDETLRDGRQALLFINRRGSASSQICTDCGTVSLCPNCTLPLTFHADHLQLICHYCNFRRAPVAVCESCGSTNLRYLGGGTKRIEAEVARLYPSARLARLDRDSLTPGYLTEVYKGLHDGTIDILIGTQMIAKGLDLPNLDMVGIVSADTMLHLPDFSASERTFGLLTQVSGRAGRGDRAGKVVIQTYTPDHPVIKAAALHDYDSFAASELAERRLLAYPPYVFLLKLSCSMATSAAAESKAASLAASLKLLPGLVILGPAPAFMERSGDKFVWQIIVKAKGRQELVAVASKLPSGWTADLDPLNLL
jgi:primosomal protein N' (replication factor Y)